MTITEQTNPGKYDSAFPHCQTCKKRVAEKIVDDGLVPLDYDLFDAVRAIATAHEQRHKTHNIVIYMTEKEGEI